MTNIDISKLTGDWKLWAQQADGENTDAATANDGKINSAFEVARFKDLARQEGKTDEDINNIFGADFSQTRVEDKASTTSTDASATATPASTTTATTTVEPSKKVKEAMETAAITNLANAFSGAVVMADDEGVSWRDMVNIVTEQADKLAQNNQLLDAGYYKSLIQPMRDVALAMGSKTFDSRKDVMKLYSEVKDALELDKKDQFKDFKLNVLKQFVLIAENFQKQKEMANIGKEYSTLRKTMSREDAMEAIQKNPKFKGSYYHDYYHDGAEKAGVTKGDALRKRTGLIQEFEDTVVMNEARNDAWAAMDKQNGKTELTSYRKVRKAAKKELGDNHDKYTRKVFRGELSTADRLKFETSTTKAKGQSVGIENNVAVQTAKEYTFEELADVVKDDANVQSLLQGGLITKNDNGTYDIKPLATKIRDRVGADLVANKQKKDYYPYSEVANIVNQIAADTGAQLSDKEVKELIKLCGFKVEGKNWVKIALDSAVDTFAPALGMAAGVALSSSKLTGHGVQDVTLPYTAKVNLETLINQNVDVNLNLKLPDGVTIDGRQLYNSLLKQGINPKDIKMTYDNGKLVGVSFNMHESLKGDTTELKVHGETSDKVPTEVKVDRKLLDVLFRQIGLAYGLSFLKNAFQDDQGEIPAAVTQFKTQDINEYKRLIGADKKLTSAQKESLKNLAEQFVKDGKWNVEAYKAALNEIAGDASLLNKHELAIGADNLMKNPDTIAQLVSQNTGAEKPAETKPADSVGVGEASASTETISTTSVTPVSAPVEDNTRVAAQEEFEEKPLEANYHNANKHTWKGLASLYADCRTNNPRLRLIDIIHAIKDANGIKYSDNVIPANLYLPEQLFSENAGKIKTFDSDSAKEAYIKKHDANVDIAKTVKRSATKLGVYRTSKGFRGIKIWYDNDGKTVIAQKTTTETYQTADEAKKQAEKLQKE